MTAFASRGGRLVAKVEVRESVPPVALREQVTPIPVIDPDDVLLRLDVLEPQRPHVLKLLRVVGQQSEWPIAEKIEQQRRGVGKITAVIGKPQTAVAW